MRCTAPSHLMKPYFGETNAFIPCDAHTICLRHMVKWFLSLHKLEQYHEAFINAGATEQDLPQFLEFNEHELDEFLTQMDILPFHLVKLKKALREMKMSPEEDILSGTSEEYDQPSTMSREFIISHATIYGKKTSRSLTSYQEAINRASVQLALENPMLVIEKGRLFEEAKKKLLDEGYHYKRGRSRSKLQSSSSQHQQSSKLEKRELNARRQSDRRLNKINALQDQVEEMINKRKSSECRLEQHERGTSAYLLIEAEVVGHEERRAELLKEISKIKAQERKHQWYKKRKLERSNSSQLSLSSMDEDNNNKNSQLSFMSQDSNTTLDTTASDNDQEEDDEPPSRHHHHQQHQLGRYNSSNLSNRSSSFLDSSQDSSCTTFSLLSDEGFSIPSSSNICPRESDVRASAIER
ncbi:hypothetical protein K501DRAFT_272510 [Backusella circina FSU 941]|nr:hypothetical protein K501DRAFT_272510 [Backusella circina FSU 941]